MASKSDSVRCPACDEKFGRTSNLTEHIKLKHKISSGKELNIGLPRKKCIRKSCSSAFKQMSNFVVHFKRQHLNECMCTDKSCKHCETKLRSAKNKWRIHGEIHRIDSNPVVCEIPKYYAIYRSDPLTNNSE